MYHCLLQIYNRDIRPHKLYRVQLVISKNMSVPSLDNLIEFTLDSH